MLGFHPISAAPISALRTLQTPDVVDSCYDTNLYEDVTYQRDVDGDVDQLPSQIFSVDDVVSSYDASAEESLEADVDGDQLSAEVFNTPAAVADDVIPSSDDPGFEEIFEDQDTFCYVIEADAVLAIDVIDSSSEYDHEFDELAQFEFASNAVTDDAAAVSDDVPASSYEPDFEDLFDDRYELFSQVVDDNAIVESLVDSADVPDYSGELSVDAEIFYVIEADAVLAIDVIDSSSDYDHEFDELAQFEFASNAVTDDAAGIMQTAQDVYVIAQEGRLLRLTNERRALALEQERAVLITKPRTIN